MIEAKGSSYANAGKETKRLCKQTSCIAGLLKGSLDEGKNNAVKSK